MSAQPRVLLAGFEPFDGAATNPSWEAVHLLARRGIVGASVATLRLPVEFGRAGERLRAEIADLAPELVIVAGLDSTARAVRLERLAVNLDDARIPDNAGRQPVDVPSVEGAPLARHTTLPVKAIYAELVEAGIPAALSMSAGGFVCNHVFMHLLDALERTGARGGLVHVPPASMLPIEVTAEALRCAVLVALGRGDDLRVPGGTVA